MAVNQQTQRCQMVRGEHRARAFVLGTVSTSRRGRFAAAEVGLKVRMEFTQVMPEACIVGRVRSVKGSAEATSEVSDRPQVLHEVVAVAGKVA